VYHRAIAVMGETSRRATGGWAAPVLPNRPRTPEPT